MKKVFSILGILLFFTVAVFAQDNSPAGSWAKDNHGISDYFLEIDENYITFVNNEDNEKAGTKKGDYIKWKYTVSDDCLVFGNIIDKTTTILNSEIYTPIYKENNSRIKFERSGNKMTIYFNEKGVKFKTKEAKDDEGESVLAFLLTLGAAAIDEATDTVATKDEVKKLAEKVYDAAW